MSLVTEKTSIAMRLKLGLKKKKLFRVFYFIIKINISTLSVK